MSIARGPLERASDEIASERIDLGAMVEEVAACGELCVDGRPVERSDVVVVAVMHGCTARVDEAHDGRKIATLCGGVDGERHLVLSGRVARFERPLDGRAGASSLDAACCWWLDELEARWRGEERV